jgi:hypothetical protein
MIFSRKRGLSGSLFGIRFVRLVLDSSELLAHFSRFADSIVQRREPWRLDLGFVASVLDGGGARDR